MTATMKGLLKGLRYITRVFEDEKEPEMQIGNPTDVKHVAHIGWEGPSANKPTWMNEFKGPESEREASGSTEGLNQKPAKEGKREGKKEAKNKTRRKQSAGGTSSPLDSPRRSSGSETSRQSRKQSRQRKSKGSMGGGDSSAAKFSSRGKDGNFS